MHKPGRPWPVATRASYVVAFEGLRRQLRLSTVGSETPRNARRVDRAARDVYTWGRAERKWIYFRWPSLQLPRLRNKSSRTGWPSTVEPVILVRKRRLQPMIGSLRRFWA
jgi:hypothetical protein